MQHCLQIDKCTYWFCKDRGECLEAKLEGRVKTPQPKKAPRIKAEKVSCRHPEPITKKKKNKIIFPPDVIHGNYRGVFCHYCGRLVNADKITRDHKIPVSKGGTGAKYNIVPSCRDCNTEKANSGYVEYLLYRSTCGKNLSKTCREFLESNHLLKV